MTLGHMESLNNKTTSQFFLSPPTISPISISWLFYHHHATQKVSSLWLQCLQCSEFSGLTCFRWYLRTHAIGVRQLFYKWEPSIRKKKLLFLILKLILTKIVINIGSWYFWFEELYFLQHSVEGIVTRH